MQTYETGYGFRIEIAGDEKVPSSLDSDRPRATCYPAQRNEPPHVCPFFNGFTGGGNACMLAILFLKHKLTSSGGRVLPRCMR